MAAAAGTAAGAIPAATVAALGLVALAEGVELKRQREHNVAGEVVIFLVGNGTCRN